MACLRDPVDQIASALRSACCEALNVSTEQTTKHTIYILAAKTGKSAETLEIGWVQAVQDTYTEVVDSRKLSKVQE